MSQFRYWIATFNDYPAAAEAKKKLQETNPGKNYQIRKGTESKNRVFRVVERLEKREAQIVQETKKPTGYTKRPSKRQRRERAIDSILR